MEKGQDSSGLKGADLSVVMSSGQHEGTRWHDTPWRLSMQITHIHLCQQSLIVARFVNKLTLITHMGPLIMKIAR